MTYKELQDAVLRRRFDEGSRESAKQWLQDRYGKVWQYANWPIKQSTQLTLTVTGGTATVPLPGGMTWTSQGIDLYDNWGIRLTYLEPEDFFDTYGSAPSSPVPNNDPAAWTLATDPSATGALVFRLGPTPSGNQTFTVRGWNLPIKRTGAATWTLGAMSAETDLPWWPDDFHFFLVPGAQALGLKLENDPTWPALQQEFVDGVEGLHRFLMLGGRSEIRQWGDSSFGT